MKAPDVYILLAGTHGQSINFIKVTDEKHLVESRLEFFIVFTFWENKDANYWQDANTFKNVQTIH